MSNCTIGLQRLCDYSAYRKLTKRLIEAWFTYTAEWIPAYIKPLSVDITLSRNNPEELQFTPVVSKFVPVQIALGEINCSMYDNANVYTRRHYKGPFCEHIITIIPGQACPVTQLTYWYIDDVELRMDIFIDPYEHLPNGALQFLGERLDYYANKANHNTLF